VCLPLAFVLDRKWWPKVCCLVVLHQKSWKCGYGYWNMYLFSTFQAARAWPSFCCFEAANEVLMTANDLLIFCLKSTKQGMVHGHGESVLLATFQAS
jgi:hypothetical protein